MMHRGRALRFSIAAWFIFASLACERYSEPPQSTGDPAVETVSASGVEMVLIPAGTFPMGSANGSADEAPVHRVSVSAFAMDRYEVTQDQLARLQIPNPSKFKGDRLPVEQIRWSDAVEFCNERSESEGLAPCYDLDTFECRFDSSGYRLPTEAEWEYACRAGSSGDSDPPFRAGGTHLKSYACYAANSGKRSRPVGTRRPNRWGLHDMYGNVSEWCHDVYATDHYAVSSERDPRGPPEGKHRVLRGGSWASRAEDCRAARRRHDNPGTTDACFARSTYGFRCVRRLNEKEREMLARAASGK